ncbi:PREDICTED: uncharacterized protein LOC108768541 [Trachymyrmex cornetzi]|uniref:uncharacterized protein LOC108768541 n=1 Tax=Trachymyrmex cornetzi TaxID=471704 RepID=UPI00084F3AEA|nr:PREDICTED: uncharacterized protein LOC108768541 [Trachymyrmex cornetzi]
MRRALQSEIRFTCDLRPASCVFLLSWFYIGRKQQIAWTQAIKVARLLRLTFYIAIISAARESRRKSSYSEMDRRVQLSRVQLGATRPHSVELRLAVTLSFLAHSDSINSKAWEFRIGRSTVYIIVHEVCRALWLGLQPTFLPEPDKQRWSKVAEGFFEKWQFPNCLGALDGKHIRIQTPSNSGSQFWNYKKYFSIVLLAMCDAYHKFVWVDIGQYGPCNLPRTAIKTNHVFIGCLELPCL